MGKYRNNRSSLQVVVDILSLANNGAKKTHIMYRGNMSYLGLQRYLDKVLAAGLVRLGDDGIYETTEKGLEFLERCKRYLRDSKLVRKEINNTQSKRKELEVLLS